MGRLQRWVGGVVAVGSLAAGAGWAQDVQRQPLEPGSSDVRLQPGTDVDVKVKSEPPSTAVTPAEPGRRVEASKATGWEAERKAKTRGYVLLGGGLDIYTGGLGNSLRNAPSLGVTAGVTRKTLGLEAQYSAGVVEGQSGEFGASRGTDAVRNSGQLAVTGGLLDTKLQPFALVGVGFDNYNVRNGNQAQGWRDDTAFNIPAGVGVRFAATRVINVDARMTYNFLQGENFVPGGATGNRMQGLISAGGRF